MNKESFFVKYKFTIILLVIMVISTIFVILFGKTTIEGIPPLSIAMISILAIVGISAGLLGGWIGTGGCSVMLPVLHFWLGFPSPIAIGTTLFAVIFTAISGGYGHFKQKNLDRRVTLWMGAAGIIGVIIGSWLFTFLSTKSELLGAIIGIVFLWPSFRMIWEGIKDSRMIVRWLLLGVLLAAAIRTFVPIDSFQTYFGATLAGLGLTLIVATILEICSEGSTPIAADLVVRANAPGNGFAFLMTGVATDYTEIMSLKETTGSWKIALFLPLITVPQVVLLSWLMNIA